MRYASNCLAKPLTLATQILLQYLGAAAAISASSVPAWKAGYTDHIVGGLLIRVAMLSSAGNLGKGMMVILSLSVVAANGPTIFDEHAIPDPHSAASGLPQTCVRGVRQHIVRFGYFMPLRWDLKIAQRITPLSVAGQTKFYNNLSNFLGLIGCWSDGSENSHSPISILDTNWHDSRGSSGCDPS